MIIDSASLARIGIGNRELDHLTIMLTPENALLWVEDLIAMIQDKDDTVAYGAAVTLGGCVHSITCNLGDKEPELSIPEVFLRDDEIAEVEDESDNLTGIDKIIYDLLILENLNTRYYQGIFSRIHSVTEYGFLTALVTMIIDGFIGLGIHAGYLNTFIGETEALAGAISDKELKQMLEYVLELANEAMMDIAGYN